jgi:hypothetical protein
LWAGTPFFILRDERDRLLHLMEPQMIPVAEHFEKLRQIEATITSAEDCGLRARWEFGRYMLTLKTGKQLPKGVIKQLADNLHVNRSELSARMKFAAKYSGHEQLSDVIRKFGSWYRIVHEALSDGRRPRTRIPVSTAAGRLMSFLEDFDAEKLAPEQADVVRDALIDAVKRIDAIAAMRKEAA